MAAPTNPTWLSTPFADSGDKTASIPESGTDVMNMATGFPAIFSKPRDYSGKSVSRKDMNGILNAMSSLNYYYQYMGRNPYVSGKSYPQGAKVWFVGTSDTTGEYIQSSEADTTVSPPNSPWIKINNLAGTVGGASVDCAWSSRSSDIPTLISNSNNIPGIITSLASLSANVSTLQDTVSNLTEMTEALYTKIDSIAPIGQFQMIPDDYVIISGTNSGVLCAFPMAWPGYIVPQGNPCVLTVRETSSTSSTSNITTLHQLYETSTLVNSGYYVWTSGQASIWYPIDKVTFTNTEENVTINRRSSKSSWDNANVFNYNEPYAIRISRTSDQYPSSILYITVTYPGIENVEYKNYQFTLSELSTNKDDGKKIVIPQKSASSKFKIYCYTTTGAYGVLKFDILYNS